MHPQDSEPFCKPFLLIECSQPQATVVYIHGGSYDIYIYIILYNYIYIQVTDIDLIYVYYVLTCIMQPTQTHQKRRSSTFAQIRSRLTISRARYFPGCSRSSCPGNGLLMVCLGEIFRPRKLPWSL